MTSIPVIGGERINKSIEKGRREGTGGASRPTLSWSKIFFHLNSENIKFVHVKNMWDFSLFIEQGLSDKN